MSRWMVVYCYRIVSFVRTTGVYHAQRKSVLACVDQGSLPISQSRVYLLCIPKVKGQYRTELNQPESASGCLHLFFLFHQFFVCDSYPGTFVWTHFDVRQ